MKHIEFNNRKIATIDVVLDTTSRHNGMFRVEILSAQGCWFSLATKHFHMEKEAVRWAIANRDTSKERGKK